MMECVKIDWYFINYEKYYCNWNNHLSNLVDYAL